MSNLLKQIPSDIRSRLPDQGREPCIGGIDEDQKGCSVKSGVALVDELLKSKSRLKPVEVPVPYAYPYPVPSDSSSSGDVQFLKAALHQLELRLAAQGIGYGGRVGDTYTKPAHVEVLRERSNNLERDCDKYKQKAEKYKEKCEEMKGYKDDYEKMKEFYEKCKIELVKAQQIESLNEKMEDQVKDLKKKIEDLEKQLEESKKQLEESKKQLEESKAQLILEKEDDENPLLELQKLQEQGFGDSDGEMEKLNNELKDKQIEINNLKNELNELKNKPPPPAPVTSQDSEWKKKYDDLVSQLQKKIQEAKKLQYEETKKKYETKINDLTDSLKKLQEIHSNCKKDSLIAKEELIKCKTGLKASVQDGEKLKIVNEEPKIVKEESKEEKEIVEEEKTSEKKNESKKSLENILKKLSNQVNITDKNLSTTITKEIENIVNRIGYKNVRDDSDVDINLKYQVFETIIKKLVDSSKEKQKTKEILCNSIGMVAEGKSKKYATIINSYCIV